MHAKQTLDLSLLSWNILAPCWVEKEWYPSSYQLAADSETRMNRIASIISSQKWNVIMIQEAQEDRIPLLKEKVNKNYLYEFAPNNPTISSIPNGLLTMIDKDWKYATEAKVINGILDPEKGEAIQIINIPSKNIHLVNLHLDYIDSLSQAKMVTERCNQLIGKPSSMSVMAGDFNAEKDIYEQFQWIGCKNVFNEANKENIIPSYYADPDDNEPNVSIDHIFYNPNQVTLVDYGKAWNVRGRSLEDALKLLGSDHIYVWASFNFIKNKFNY